MEKIGSHPRVERLDNYSCQSVGDAMDDSVDCYRVVDVDVERDRKFVQEKKVAGMHCYDEDPIMPW
jgi:hypothetical protein